MKLFVYTLVCTAIYYGILLYTINKPLDDGYIEMQGRMFSMDNRMRKINERVETLENEVTRYRAIITLQRDKRK